MEHYDEEGLDQWKESISFLSVRKIFNDIVEEEERVAQSYEGLTEEELLALSDEPIRHGELSERHRNMLMVETMDDDGGQFFVKNIHSEQMSRVVNEDGLVIIGRTIFQHTKKHIKTMDGPETDIPLLIAAVQDDELHNIHVFPASSAAMTDANSFGSMGVGYNGPNRRLKILLYEGFTQTRQTNSAFDLKTSYRMTVRTLKRRWWSAGLWYDNYNTTIVASGNHIGNTTYFRSGSAIQFKFQYVFQMRPLLKLRYIGIADVQESSPFRTS